MVSDPAGKNPVKSPVVEVEAVDVADVADVAETVEAETVALEEASSEYETDSDDSADWDTLSHGGDTIQFLRDEQLRDGLGMSTYWRSYIAPFTPSSPRSIALSQQHAWLTWRRTLVPGACTLEEAVAFRKRLHEIGKAAFVEETLARETVTAKKLCTAFGIMPPAFLEGAPDESYHPLLAVALSREFARRPKLPDYNTVEDAVRLLQECTNIIVLTGAGVSLLFVYVPYPG